MPASQADEWLPLNASDFHILLSLADGEAHGYAIMQEVAERTAGRTRLGPGTLYGAIKRMLADGLVVEGGERSAPNPGEERRRYYRLTPLGRRVAAAEAERLADLVRVAAGKKLLPASFLGPAG
jgi:DNA-binding PadR family transcriptional regulator